MIKAPFSAEQIAALNDYQYWNSKPLTCKNGHKHPPMYALGAQGMMVATQRGFICPYCDHTQDWADGSMMKKSNIFMTVNVPKEYKL